MPTAPSNLSYRKGQRVALVGPPPFWHQQTELIDKAGICIHPVYQRNSRRTAEDVFTSGQWPKQGCWEQEAPKAEASLPDSNWRAGQPLGPCPSMGWICSLACSAHAGHKKFETVIQKANTFKYFMARNVILIFSFQCHIQRITHKTCSLAVRWG